MKNSNRIFDCPHERLLARTRLVLLVVAALLATSCAYGYASREGKVTPERPAATVRVSLPDEAKPAPEEEEQKAPSPCGVRTFDVHLYTSTARQVKTIDCLERKVVNVSRSPIGQSYLDEAREARLPQDIWYILVDPKGVRANYVSSDNITRLSGHFEVRFVGRDTTNDLLVYEYLDEL